MTPLQPCPFCGGEPYVRQGHRHHYRAECLHCGVALAKWHVGEGQEAEALAAWNARAAPAPGDDGAFYKAWPSSQQRNFGHLPPAEFITANAAAIRAECAEELAIANPEIERLKGVLQTIAQNGHKAHWTKTRIVNTASQQVFDWSPRVDRRDTLIVTLTAALRRAEDKLATTIEKALQR